MLLYGGGIFSDPYSSPQSQYNRRTGNHAKKCWPVKKIVNIPKAGAAGGWAGRVTYPAVSAGKPAPDLVYDELPADEYKVYLSKDVQTYEDEITIDPVGGTYYQKLRVNGVRVCG